MSRDLASSGAPAALEGLRRIAMPVCVVCAADGEDRSCATATLVYVSVDPPVILAPLARSSHTLRLLEASGAFSVTLLAAGQEALADLAGRPAGGADKLAGLLAAGSALLAPPAAGGPPALGGGVAALWCRVAAGVPAGERVLCLATVTAVRLGPPQLRPLVRYDRRYHALGTPADPRRDGSAL